MPGSVGNAVPVGVLPLSLSRAFTHARQHTVIGNDYANGESQRSVLTTSSRKQWKLSKRLTATVLATLRTFYNDHKGPLISFYFYDPWQTDPMFSYDPNGEALTGRYTVRFAGGWKESVGVARHDVELELVELA